MKFVTVLCLFLLPSLVLAAPTRRPTKRPTKRPSKRPTSSPTKVPTKAPTKSPTNIPTKVPTAKPTPSFSAVAQKIAAYSPGGLSAFVPGSYQLKALQYVESLSGANSFVASKAVQYYTLACLYYATNGVANPITKATGATPTLWIGAKNWLSKTVAPCSTWTGITCANGKVTKLELPNNGLSGTVPLELILLSADNLSGAGSISYIDFSSNAQLYTDGDKGPVWISGLGSGLQILYLGFTSFSATKGIPNIFSNLKNLAELDISYTHIIGALKSTPFSTLTKLNYLDISGNAYNSTIPTGFGALPSLIYLYVVNSNVVGDLSFLPFMTKMQELWVDQNSLKGTIPTQIGNLLPLASFSASRNQLSGSFPSQMTKLVNMQQMYFHVNKLSGSFPNSFTTLKSLAIFHLESNNVQGTVSTLCSSLSRSLTSLGVDCGSPSKVQCPSTCRVCCCSITECMDDV